jgi:hypothetical protein
MITDIDWFLMPYRFFNPCSLRLTRSSCRGRGSLLRSRPHRLGARREKIKADTSKKRARHARWSSWIHILCRKSFYGRGAVVPITTLRSHPTAPRLASRKNTVPLPLEAICATGGMPAPDPPNPPMLRVIRRPLPPLRWPVGLRTADVQQHISARQRRGPSPSQGRRQPSRWRYDSIAKRHQAREQLLRTMSQLLDDLPLLKANPRHYRREERQHWNE